MNGRVLLSFGFLLTTSVYHATVLGFSFGSPEQRVARAMRQMEKALRECRAENGRPVDSQQCKRMRARAMRGIVVNGSAMTTGALFDAWREESEVTEQVADQVWNDHAEREAVLLGHLDGAMDETFFSRLADLPGAQEALAQLGYDSKSCFDKDGKTKRECRMMLLMLMRMQFSVSDLLKKSEQKNGQPEEDKKKGIGARVASLIERLPF